MLYSYLYLEVVKLGLRVSVSNLIGLFCSIEASFSSVLRRCVVRKLTNSDLPELYNFR